MGNLQEAVRKFASDLADKVETFIEDVSELEVCTYTTPHDQIQVMIGPDKDIHKLVAEGKIKLRAYTQIKFDGDTLVCIPEDANGEPDRALWDMHQDIVAQTQENRAEMLRAIGDAASSALGALRRVNE